MGDVYGMGTGGVERPAPRNGASILRRRCDALDAQAVAPILMRHLNMLRLDAMEACTRAGGLLVDNVAPPAAESIVAELRGLGEDCIIVPAAGIVPLPARQVVHSASLTQATVRFTDGAGRETEAAWSQGAALVMGSVPMEETEMKSVPTPLWKRPVVGRVPIATTTTEMVTTRKPETVVDIAFLDPLVCYRIIARQFDYSILADQLQLTAEANIVLLGRWFAYEMPHARTNFDAGALMKTGHVQIGTYENHALGNVLQWLVNLAVHDRAGK